MNIYNCESYLGKIQVQAETEKDAQCKAARELGVPLRKQYTIDVQLLPGEIVTVNEWEY